MSTQDSPQAPEATACYRHPDRPTGVICQRCDRYICTKCMHQASVGVHCPECVKGNKQKVYTRTNLPGSDATVTRVLIGLNVAVFLLQFVLWDATLSSDGETARHLAVNGSAIDFHGEWWRIITSGFGHFGIFHLLMNMYSLYILGPLLEKRLGPVRFSLAYAASLVGGSMGGLLVKPDSFGMGASGAIFGLLGLVVMIFRSQGISIAQSQLGPVLLLNLFISLSGYVSFGGHAGGFVVGLALGAMYFGPSPHAGPIFGRDQVKPDLVTAGLTVLLFLGALWAATRWTILYAI